MDARSLTEFELAIRKLKRSKLTWTPEFNDMLLAIERFQRDGKLDSLTRKSKNEFIHRLEDAQFFSILLGMLTEVSRSSGLKQRDDLRKVYHWYQMNKDVLHCQPHFQSVSSSPGRNSAPKSRTRIRHGTSGSGTMVHRQNAQNRLLDRPETAPPGLNRPKAGDSSSGNRKSWRGQQMFVSESGLSLSYIDSQLNPQKYLAALDRPATAEAALQQSHQEAGNEDGGTSMGDAELGVGPPVDDQISPRDPERDGEVQSHQNKSEKTNEKGDDGGHSHPHQANLQKWHTYQQDNNGYHSNSISSTNQEDPFRMEGMMVEMPELNTDRVISEFAESSPLELPGEAHYSTAQSLQEFYETSEKFSPSVDPKKSALDRISGGPSKPPSDQRDLNRNYGNAGAPPNAVMLESVVDLAGHVSDQMVLNKEFQRELMEPRLRHRPPATEIPPPAPRLGPARSHINIPDGRNSLASTPRSNRSEESDRGSMYAGDAVIGYPVRSDYTVHFRREPRPFTAPMPLFQCCPQHAPVQPDTTRYRSRSASPGISLRTAGSTSGGGRPSTTSSQSSRGYRRANKTKILVPGAASHASSTIHPLTISSMVSVRYLGGASSNFRDDLNRNGTHPWSDQGIPDDLPPNLEFMSFTRPAPVHDAVSDARSVREEASPGSSATDGDTPTPVETSLERTDSMEGLVRLGLARSERDAQEAESQDGVSSGANSDRGVSPPPGDLSDVDGSDHMEGTLREGERGVGIATEGAENSTNNGGDILKETVGEGGGSVGIAKEEVIAGSWDNSVTDGGDTIGEFLREGERGVGIAEEGVTDEGGKNGINDGSDSIGGTPREGGGVTGTAKEGVIDGDMESGINDEIAGDGDIVHRREGDMMEETAKKAELVDETSVEDEGVNIADGSERKSGDGDGAANEVQMLDAAFKQESHPEQPQREGVPSDGTAGDGANPGGVDEPRGEDERVCRIPGESEISDDLEPGERNMGGLVAGLRKYDQTQGVSIVDGMSAEGGGMVIGTAVEDEPTKVATSVNAVDEGASRGPQEEQPVGETVREGESIVETAGEEGATNGTAGEQGTIDADNREKRLVGTESGAHSIIESFEDEDYYDYPYRLYDEGHPYVRSPQVVIPKVRDPNGRLTDAELDLEAAVKPLNPRGIGRDDRTVTSSGIRGSKSCSKRNDGSVYLLAEGEPSDAEQRKAVAADVRKKPLWEREWMRRAWRTYHYRAEKDVITPYRLRVLEEKQKSSSGTDQSPSRATNPEDQTPKIAPRRPQTPKRFEALEPKPQKPVRDEWRGRPLPDVISNMNEGAERRAFERKKVARQAVRISELFSGEADREMDKMKKQLEWGRWEKRWEEADAAERKQLGDQLRREAALSSRLSEVTNETWEKQYRSRRKSSKQRKKKALEEEIKRRRRKSTKEKEYLSRVAASLDIWDIYREGRRGTTKGERKKAAIMIQKHVRGWLARRQFEKIKQKSRVHATSYSQFAGYYSKFMTKVARWHGVKSPSIHIDLKEVDRYMDKKRYYETEFAKVAYPKKTLEYEELGEFFKSCDLYPTQREMHNAVLAVTKRIPDDPHMPITEEQISEIASMIYVPDGSRLDKSKTRQSTWLNPLIDGKEASKFVGSKEYREAKLSTSMQVVFDAHRERLEREEAVRRQDESQSEDEESRGAAPTEDERKKKELEEWIKNEEVREEQEEEKRSRPIREGELVTNYQMGDIGLLEEEPE